MLLVAGLDGLVTTEAEHLRQRLAALVEARREMTEAQARLDQAVEEVNEAMRRYGHRLLLDEEPIPLPLLRALYWDYLEVGARQIATSFGIRAANDVHRLVGPDRRTANCRGGCGRTVERNRASRAAAQASGGHGSRSWRLCDDCRERLAVEEQATADRWAQRHAQEDAEDRELLHQAIASGRKPVARFVEYEGVPGTWHIDDDGS